MEKKEVGKGYQKWLDLKQKFAHKGVTVLPWYETATLAQLEAFETSVLALSPKAPEQPIQLHIYKTYVKKRLEQMRGGGIQTQLL